MKGSLRYREARACSGFALFLLVEILGFHSSTFFVGFDGFDTSVWITFGVATLLTRIIVYLIFVLFSPGLRREPSIGIPLSLLLSAASCLGIALIFVSLNSGQLSLLVLGTALFSGSQGAAGVSWLTILVKRTFRSSYFFVLSGHIIATILCALLLLLPYEWLPATMACCLIAANAVLAFQPKRAIADLTIRSRLREVASALWKGVLAVGVFAVLSGVVTAIAIKTTVEFDPLAIQYPVLSISTLTLLIMFIPAAVLKRPLTLDTSTKVALPLSALAFLVLPGFIEGIPPFIAGALASSGYMMCGLVLYCAIAKASKATGTPATPLFAGSEVVSRLCFFVGLLLGLLVADGHMDTGLSVAFIGLGCLFLIVVGGSYLFERTGSAKRAESPAAAGQPCPRSLEAIAEANGLSKTEKAVLIQLLEGRTLPRIAQDLYLSTGTVKYHTQKIYRHFDVHSRSELSQLISEIRSAWHDG